jgi:hypothetical protein
MPKKAKKKSVRRGPKPEVLVIEGNWKDAVRESFEKKTPATGWPKPPTSKKTK